MGEYKISSATESNLTGTQTDYSVNPKDTDGATGINNYEWTNNKWTQQFGYYTEIPELSIAIDTKATWTVGKGYEADPQTEMLLDAMTGTGKDTFNTILENMIRTYHIGGDAYAEIITDKQKNIINIKPLDPKTITIVTNKKGRIKEYKQNAKVPNKTTKTFEPNKIFHLSRNRVADQVHGVSMIDNLEEIILMRNEAMKDMKTLMHRHVKPMRVWYLETDDETEIANFKTKADNATEDAENLYLPKGTVEHEVVSVAAQATLNPLPWLDNLNKSFWQACGVPEIVVGGGGGALTEASAKIAYLAFQQTIEEEQLFIEEQVLQQLNLEIELEFPASLENELLSDNKKDGAQNIDPSETTAGRGQ